MAAPVIDRPADAVTTARNELRELVTSKGSVDLGDAIAHLQPIPVHVISRALNDLLDAGELTLTEEQELQLGPNRQDQ